VTSVGWALACAGVWSLRLMLRIMQVWIVQVSMICLDCNEYMANEVRVP
jgi:hypothetical protein